MKKKKVLLLNAEYVQSICLGRSFQNQGWMVICFCAQKCSSGYVSRYLDEHYISPDIKKDSTAFETFLIKYLENNCVDLIIPMIDDSAEYLSYHKVELENRFGLICAVAPKAIFDIARNKQRLMSLCEKFHINHPLTYKLPPYSEKEYEKILEIKNFPYPALIKPDFSAGARGIEKVNSFCELKNKISSLQNNFGSCTLQQYVEQPEHYYNVMMYRSKDNSILGATVVKIRRYFPLKGGTSCYCETIESPELLEDCKTLLERLDWHGFADFDVLEDIHSGEKKIIEINPRVPSSLQAAFAAGIDFGRIFVADLFNEELPKFEYKVGQQVRWFGLDVMWFLLSNKRFSFKPSWFRFWGENVSYQDGSWNNPLPMIAGCFAGLMKYLNPDVRKAKLGK